MNCSCMLTLIACVLFVALMGIFAFEIVMAFRHSLQAGLMATAIGVLTYAFWSWADRHMK